MEVNSATAFWSQMWHHRLHAGSELRLQRSSDGVALRPRISAGASQTPRAAPSPLSTGAGAAPPAEAPSFSSRDQPQTGVPSRDPQPSRSTAHDHPLASDPAGPPAVESPARQSAALKPQEQHTGLRLQRSAAEPSSAGDGSQQVSGLAAWPSVAPSEAAMALSAHPGPATPFATQAGGHTAGQPPRQMDTEDRYASGVTRQGWFEGTTHDFGDTPRWGPGRLVECTSRPQSGLHTRVRLHVWLGRHAAVTQLGMQRAARCGQRGHEQGWLQGTTPKGSLCVGWAGMLHLQNPRSWAATPCTTWTCLGWWATLHHLNSVAF